MTEDTNKIRLLLANNPWLQIPAGTYDIGDLRLPPACKLEGAGPGLTVLRVVEGNGLLCERESPCPALTIRDLTIETTHPAAYGLWVRAPKLFGGNRGHAAEVTLEHVEVRLGETQHAFKRGVVIENIVNARMNGVFVVGRYGDLTLKDFDDPDAMDTAFDLTGSQEAKLVGCYVHGARNGIYGNVPWPGSGEGHALVGSAVINVLNGVYLEGRPAGTFGGFNTPWLTVSNSHIFYLLRGVLAVNYHDVHITDNSLCVSHFAPKTAWKVGAYPVKVANAHIAGNTCWDTAPGMSIGVLADRCEGGSVEGNLVDASVTSAWSLPGTSGWTGRNAVAPGRRPLDPGKGNSLT